MPFTPPTAGSADSGEGSHGPSLTGGWNCPLPTSSPAQLTAMISTDQGYTVAMPIGSGSGAAEGSGVHDRPDSPHPMDEDQDLADGGVALSMHPSSENNTAMSPSHAEVLNAEMDILDAEVMGQQNLDELFLNSSPYPSPIIEEPPFSYSGPSQSSGSADDSDDDMTYEDLAHEVPSPANQPTATPAVSQHAPHLYGQEDVGEMDVPHAQHVLYADQSIPSHFFPTLPPGVPGSSLAYSPQEGHVPAASLGSTSLPTAGLALEAHHVPHLGGHGGGGAPPDTEVLLSDGGQNTPPVPNSEISWDDDLLSETDHQIEVNDQFNLSLMDFLYTWGRTSARDDGSARKMLRGPVLPAILRQRNLGDLAPVQRSDLQGDRCDIQRINWVELGVSRQEARQMRRHTYKNYTNLRLPPHWHPRLNLARVSDDENYFKFRRMNFDHDVHLSHFQLRNLVACASRDHIFYAGVSKVMEYKPNKGRHSYNYPSTTMDLTEPVVQPYHAFSTGVQISTLTTAHGILVAGGFCGEYGIVNLKANRSVKHTEGLISDHPNSITNHVQVHLSRSSSSPLVAFSSNDNGLRLLDVNTNKFIAEHKYSHAINCSAISPDQRLRVLVGDDRKVMICNADTGEVLQALDSHRDFGFACDWADDGWTVATGNQDMQVKIWDARKWTNSHGAACPVATVAAEMAGVRKLKFSPVGAGRRVLAAAEPADFVSLIDATSFARKQTLGFFGEIGGLDFTDDGRDLVVANCDGMRGGIMEFERCDFAREAFPPPDPDCDRPRDRDGWGGDRARRERMPALLGTAMAPF